MNRAKKKFIIRNEQAAILRGSFPTDPEVQKQMRKQFGIAYVRMRETAMSKRQPRDIYHLVIRHPHAKRVEFVPICRPHTRRIIAKLKLGMQK